MPQVVNIAEDYSIGSPTTGDLVLSRLVLTGWGAVTTAVPALETWTDRGRLWAVFTQSSGDLSFYRRPTYGSGDKVCSGTVSSGLVTLSQANTSGVSGSCEATNGTLGTSPTVNGACSVIVSYAHENDLIDRYAAVTSYLDTNSKWYAQNTRLEAILRASKRELDEWIATRLGARLRPDAQGRRNLAIISDPRQIAPIHAMYALGMIERHRAGLNPAYREAANQWFNEAFNLLKRTEIALDYQQDAQVDANASVSSGYLVR